MQNYIKFARIADYVFSGVFALVAAYFLVKHNYLMAGLMALTALVSFVSAKAALARRVATHIMLARLNK